MKRFALAALTLLALSACTPPSVASDAGTDVVTTDIVDSGADVPTADVQPCDPGAPLAGLPVVQSQFVIPDDGGTVPTPAGGDPTGAWKVERITIYLPPLARGQIDTQASTVTGQGWAVIDADRYRMSLDLVMTLETAAVGTVPRPIQFGGRGTYTLQGANLMLAPECATGTAAAQNPMIGFSRDAPDRGRMFLRVTAMGSNITLVLDLVH